MSAIATAVVGGAIIGGIAQDRAAGKAADAQGDASAAGIAEQRRQFDKVTQLLAPYSNAAIGSGPTKESRTFNSDRYLAENPDVAANWDGTAQQHWEMYGKNEGRSDPFDVTPASAGTKGSLSAQQDLLGLNGVDAQKAAIDQIQSSPLFASLANQGETAMLQNASATGGVRGGNTQGALAQFRPQLLNQLIDQQYSRLGGLTTLGQNSAAGQASAAQQTGTNVANLLGQQGAATAGRYLAQGQAIANVGNSLGTGLIAARGF